MNDDLKRRCEESFYSELYHFDETSQDLVIDKTTGRVMLRKVLDNYDLTVFNWLKDNSNIHIPAIYSFYEEDNKLIVHEEYIQGETLDSILKTKSVDFREKLRILFDICDALIFLHNAPVPVIHRDIKALNIMLTTDKIVKLIDFDASKTFHPGKSVDTTLIGTVGAAAPEQYGFRQSDTRTDIYSLGILIKEIFPNDRRFSRIIDKATQLEPKLRYQSVSEMKIAIEKDVCHRTKSHSKIPFVTICIIIGLILIIIFVSKHLLKLANNISTITQDWSETQISEYDRSDTAYKSEQTDHTAVMNGEGKIDIKSGKNNGLSINESCWYVSTDDYSNGVYIQYAAIISNNTDNLIEFPGIRVTAKHKDNTVLGTDDMIGSCIMPRDSIVLGNLISASDCMPSDIDDVIFSVCNGDPNPSKSSATSDDFTITGVKEHKDALFPNITGEIASKYPDSISTVAITAVFRRGKKLVAAETDYVHDLRPNTPTAFQFNISGQLPEYDSVEIVAKTW